MIKKVFNKNLSNWYDFIGYNPQDMLYLLNDTIKNNIALGINNENIDLNLVSNALKHSNSTKFVDNLPKKLRLMLEIEALSSGGQKQRIGIARAFYKKSKILILDEATNSLDFKNESEIVNHIMSLEDITVFIIAHNVHVH